MLSSFLKFLFFTMVASSLAFSSDVLAVVNGENITSDVAPKDFKKLDKDMQKKIVSRLVEKRLASTYALSSKISKSPEYQKALEHVLQMSSDKKSKDDSLANLFKKDSSIEGYTIEQLNSKKGLLAFDFILNQKAETMKFSEKELKEFYESRKYKYDTPALIELLTIVVNDKEVANDILKQLEVAEDRLQNFSKLAAEHSLAPSAKDHGYFGKIPVNQLNDTLKSFLKDLKRNDYLKTPIKTEFGYQLFYVLNDIPEFNSTYESVQSMVEEELIKREVKSWAINKIKELKKNAKIEIKI